MQSEGIFTKKTIIHMVFLVNIPSDRVKQLFSLFSTINQDLAQSGFGKVNNSPDQNKQR